jgi:hypothetical protein
MYVNTKMMPVETVPGFGAVKDSSGGGEFRYDIFDTM